MDRSELLNYLLRVARPVIRAAYPKPNSCIPSTQVAIGVCEVFGIPARRLRVTAVIHAPSIPGWQALNDKSPSGLLTWAREHGADVAGIGGGGLPGNESWPGHLVALVTEDTLLDLSLDQADRGRIRLRPCMVSLGSFDDEVVHGFLEDGKGLPVVLDDNALMYYVEPEDAALMVGWTSHLVTADVVVRVIAGDILGMDPLQGFEHLYVALAAHQD